MRINFNSQYKDVAHLLNQPVVKTADQNQARASFRAVFDEAAPAVPEKSKKIKDSGLLSYSQVQSKPKGHFPDHLVETPLKASEPEVKLPEPERRAVITDAAEPLEQPLSGVKRPTILSAARLGTDVRGVPLTRSEWIREVQEMVSRAGATSGIDPALGLAVLEVESGFDPKAVSRDGHASKGLFQLLDSTAEDVISRNSIDDEYEPFNPVQNVNLGTLHLRYLLDLFSTSTGLSHRLTTVPAANSSSLEKLAVAAYNAGEGRVASAQLRASRNGGDPSDYEQIAPYLPESTVKYVKRVLEKKAEAESVFSG
jgi:hypothetical protein